MTSILLSCIRPSRSVLLQRTCPATQSERGEYASRNAIQTSIPGRWSAREEHAKVRLLATRHSQKLRAGKHNLLSSMRLNSSRPGCAADTFGISAATAVGVACHSTLGLCRAAIRRSFQPATSAGVWHPLEPIGVLAGILV